MNGSGLKIAAIAAVGLAIVLGLLAWRTTMKATETAREEAIAEALASAPLQEATTLAVIALQSLPANKPIDADSVALKAIPITPPRYYTTVEDVIGRVPLLDIDAGAPVTPRYFKDANILARLIPDEHQAVSIEVTDVVAVGGFVRPGDRVDLLLFLRDAEQRAQSRILLRDVLVLAYEERVIERPEGLEDNQNSRIQRGRLRTAVVAIPVSQTTRIMLGASVGEIRLALRRQIPDLAAEQSTLPEAAPSPTPVIDLERPITLAELSQIKKPKPKKTVKKPPTHTVEVYRGSEMQKERTQ